MLKTRPASVVAPPKVPAEKPSNVIVFVGATIPPVADVVIDNSGSLEATHAQVVAAFQAFVTAHPAAADLVG